MQLRHSEVYQVPFGAWWVLQCVSCVEIQLHQLLFLVFCFFSQLFASCNILGTRIPVLLHHLDSPSCDNELCISTILQV